MSSSSSAPVILHVLIGDGQLESIATARKCKLQLFVTAHGASHVVSTNWDGSTSIVRFHHQTIHIPLQPSNEKHTKIHFGLMRHKGDRSFTLGEVQWKVNDENHAKTTILKLRRLRTNGLEEQTFRLSVTVFFYRFPLDFTNRTIKTNVERGASTGAQTQYDYRAKDSSSRTSPHTDPKNREYAFLLARRLNWPTDKPSSFNHKVERQLDSDVTMDLKELHNNVRLLSKGRRKTHSPVPGQRFVEKKASKVFSAQPQQKQRPTSMAVGYVGVQWPDAKGHFEEKMQYRLYLAEQRRLDTMRLIAEEYRVRADRASMRTSLTKEQRAKQTEADNKLKQILLRRDKKIERLKAELKEVKSRELKQSLAAEPDDHRVDAYVYTERRGSPGNVRRRRKDDEDEESPTARITSIRGRREEEEDRPGRPRSRGRSRQFDRHSESPEHAGLRLSASNTIWAETGANLSQILRRPPPRGGRGNEEEYRHSRRMNQEELRDPQSVRRTRSRSAGIARNTDPVTIATGVSSPVGYLASLSQYGPDDGPPRPRRRRARSESRRSTTKATFFDRVAAGVDGTVSSRIRSTGTGDPHPQTIVSGSRIRLRADGIASAGDAADMRARSSTAVRRRWRVDIPDNRSRDRGRARVFSSDGIGIGDSLVERHRQQQSEVARGGGRRGEESRSASRGRAHVGASDRFDAEASSSSSRGSTRLIRPAASEAQPSRERKERIDYFEEADTLLRRNDCADEDGFQSLHDDDIFSVMRDYDFHYGDDDNDEYRYQSYKEYLQEAQLQRQVSGHRQQSRVDLRREDEIAASRWSRVPQATGAAGQEVTDGVAASVGNDGVGTLGVRGQVKRPHLGLPRAADRDLQGQDEQLGFKEMDSALEDETTGPPNFLAAFAGGVRYSEQAHGGDEEKGTRQLSGVGGTGVAGVAAASKVTGSSANGVVHSGGYSCANGNGSARSGSDSGKEALWDRSDLSELSDHRHDYRPSSRGYSAAAATAGSSNRSSCISGANESQRLSHRFVRSDVGDGDSDGDNVELGADAESENESDGEYLEEVADFEFALRRHQELLRQRDQLLRRKRERGQQQYPLPPPSQMTPWGQNSLAADDSYNSGRHPTDTVFAAGDRINGRSSADGHAGSGATVGNTQRVSGQNSKDGKQDKVNQQLLSAFWMHPAGEGGRDYSQYSYSNSVGEDYVSGAHVQSPAQALTGSSDPGEPRGEGGVGVVGKTGGPSGPRVVAGAGLPVGAVRIDGISADELMAAKGKPFDPRRFGREDHDRRRHGLGQREPSRFHQRFGKEDDIPDILPRAVSELGLETLGMAHAPAGQFNVFRSADDSNSTRGAVRGVGHPEGPLGEICDMRGYDHVSRARGNVAELRGQQGLHAAATATGGGGGGAGAGEGGGGGVVRIAGVEDEADEGAPVVELPESITRQIEDVGSAIELLEERIASYIGEAGSPGSPAESRSFYPLQTSPGSETSPVSGSGTFVSVSSPLTPPSFTSQSGITPSAPAADLVADPWGGRDRVGDRGGDRGVHQTGADANADRAAAAAMADAAVDRRAHGSVAGEVDERIAGGKDKDKAATATGSRDGAQTRGGQRTGSSAKQSHSLRLAYGNRGRASLLASSLSSLEDEVEEGSEIDGRRSVAGNSQGGKGGEFGNRAAAQGGDSRESDYIKGSDSSSDSSSDSGSDNGIETGPSPGRLVTQTALASETVIVGEGAVGSDGGGDESSSSISTTELLSRPLTRGASSISLSSATSSSSFSSAGSQSMDRRASGRRVERERRRLLQAIEPADDSLDAALGLNDDDESGCINGDSDGKNNSDSCSDGTGSGEYERRIDHIAILSVAPAIAKSTAAISSTHADPTAFPPVSSSATEPTHELNNSCEVSNQRRPLEFDFSPDSTSASQSPAGSPALADRIDSSEREREVGEGSKIGCEDNPRQDSVNFGHDADEVGGRLDRSFSFDMDDHLSRSHSFDSLQRHRLSPGGSVGESGGADATLIGDNRIWSDSEADDGSGDGYDAASQGSDDGNEVENGDIQNDDYH